MSIFVIRHGETQNNADRVVQMPDSPLSERGELQAARVAERLGDLGVSLVLASDYARAARTGEFVSERCRAELRHLESLRERHFGEIRGRPYTEVGELMLKPDYHPPGGESWETFHARVKLAWEEVQDHARSTTGHIAVVTHGLVCHSLAVNVLSVQGDDEIPLGFGNTALTIVADQPPWRVELLACTAHLDEDPRGAIA